MAIYKRFQIFSERESLGDGQLARVWRGYKLVKDEYTGELECEYIRGTADGSLKGCKANIDDLVEEGYLN
jgi:hypothetical protein